MEENRPAPAVVPVEFTAGGRRPRRDALRNRQRVLEAARRLVAERGVAAVTMDDIAAAAGVGKGTVYRHFGSRSRLAEALLDDAERSLQGRILGGPPPLGPGGDDAARLVAFVDAYLDFLADNAELVLETERVGVGGRLHTGAYAFWHLHLRALLSGAGAGGGDPEVLAHLLLATLAADVFEHLRGLEGGVARLRTGVARLAGLLTATQISSGGRSRPASSPSLKATRTAGRRPPG